MNNIRQAQPEDIARLAEIEIFNYRMNFYPIFQCDEYYFEELQVPKVMEKYQKDVALLCNTYVYDDGVVKGFITIDGCQVRKLFVEPILQGNSIGAELLDFAIREQHANFLWALEKNERAIAFYERHGFRRTEDKKFEDDTTEYLVRLEQPCYIAIGKPKEDAVFNEQMESGL